MSEVTPAGVVSTSPFASGFNHPIGLAFDAAGNLYVAKAGDGTVSKVTPAGEVSIFASGFDSPCDLAFDASGNLYVANSANSTVSKVTPAGAGQHLRSASEVKNPDMPGLRRRRQSLCRQHHRHAVSKVSQTVAVPFTLGGSAASGAAYSGVTASPLTFGIGQTTQDITGTLLSDPGPSQTLTLTLGTPTGGVGLGSPSVNTLTITEPAGCSSAPAARP